MVRSEKLGDEAMASQAAATSVGSSPAETRSTNRTRHARGLRLTARRSRRVIALLLAIVTLSLIDLHFTRREVGRNAWFDEANPVAACVMTGSPHWLDLFKGLLTVGGSAILLAFRRYPTSESACWVLLVIHIGVQVQWARYYDAIRDNDPAVHIDRSGYAWTDAPTGPPAWMSPHTADRSLAHFSEHPPMTHH